MSRNTHKEHVGKKIDMTYYISYIDIMHKKNYGFAWVQLQLLENDYCPKCSFLNISNHPDNPDMRLQLASLPPSACAGCTAHALSTNESLFSIRFAPLKWHKILIHAYAVIDEEVETNSPSEARLICMSGAYSVINNYNFCFSSTKTLY